MKKKKPKELIVTEYAFQPHAPEHCFSLDVKRTTKVKPVFHPQRMPNNAHRVALESVLQILTGNSKREKAARHIVTLALQGG